MSTGFNDEKLISLARSRYNRTPANLPGAPRLNLALLTKAGLSNTERNELLEYLQLSDRTSLRPISMREMKQEIFNMIGKEAPSGTWVSTFSRDDIVLVYDWIKSKKDSENVKELKK